MNLFGYRLPGMSSLLLWGALWEIIGHLEVTFFLPPLSAIFATLLEIFNYFWSQGAWHAEETFLLHILSRGMIQPYDLVNIES